MNTGEIIPIFPIPIMRSNIRRSFSSEELQCISNYRTDVFYNASNVTTNDLYVLNNPALSNIKSFIESMLYDYLMNIYNPINPNEVKLGLTQSWLNYTEKNQFHHQHHHPNSVISGCLYINANKDIDNIMFGRTLPLNLQVQAINQNMYNCMEAYFPIEAGDVVLFPSNLEHSVPITSGEYTRISLAFNSYFSGKIGYLNGPNQGFNFLNITLEDQTIDNPYKKRYEK
jgi:uncharacterized protein (TIGR02466 family)